MSVFDSLNGFGSMLSAVVQCADFSQFGHISGINRWTVYQTLQ